MVPEKRRTIFKCAAQIDSLFLVHYSFPSFSMGHVHISSHVFLQSSLAQVLTVDFHKFERRELVSHIFKLNNPNISGVFAMCEQFKICV